MPWVAAVASVAGAAISADSSRKAGNKQGASSDAALEEQKRQYDLNREDNERWGMMQINGEEEMDRRNRADKERQYQRVRSDNVNAINRGDLAGNQLAHRMGLGPKRGGTAATAASGGTFDAAKYLAENPDVASDNYFAGHPEEHYNTFGKSEGRTRPAVSGTETPGTAAVAATDADNAGYGGLNERYKDFNFEKDIGYDFRQQEGQNGVNNKLAASGNLISGAGMKALARFNQDYASNELGNAYNRYNADRSAYEGANLNEYNRLMGVQGAGQNATNSVAGISGTVQGNISNAASGIGAANMSNNNAFGKAFAENSYNQGNIGAQQKMAYGNAFNQGLSGVKSAWDSYNMKQNNTSNFGMSGNDYGGSSNYVGASNYMNSMDNGYTW